MESQEKRPLGPIVENTPAVRPSPNTRLSGRYATIVGMTSEHVEALYAHISGDENAHLWDYMMGGPFHELAAYRAMIEAQIRNPDMELYAIIPTQQPTMPRDGGGDSVVDNVVGCAAYMNISTAHRSVEVGHVMFSPQLQRTPTATDAMRLMARHAFEDLGYRRYEWKCNALNAASRRAAARLGFAFEGVFRQHMVVKGRNRDTAWLAIVDGDWPAVKAALEAWLDPKNFDEHGVQRRTLESFRDNK